MQGASFESAIMHGAYFDGTQLQWSSFYRTELQGAFFRSAQLAGASFVEVQMQGVQVEGSPGFRYAIVNESFLWHAGKTICNLSHVAKPNFQEVIQVRYPRGSPALVQANEREIAEFIAHSLEDVPDKSAFNTEFSKEKLRADLGARLRAAGSDQSEPVESAWKKCAEDSAVRTSDGFQLLAENIADALCSTPDRLTAIRGFSNAWRADKLLNIPLTKLVAGVFLAGGTERCSVELDDEMKALVNYAVSPGE